eukprot:26596_1
MHVRFMLVLLSLLVTFTKSYLTCGSYGAYNTCGSGAVVRRACGSGENADCSSACGISGVYQIVGCELNYFDHSHTYGWYCNSYGANFRCPYGTAVIGLCGSGKNGDCHSYCSGAYFAVLCAKSNNVVVDHGNCKWYGWSYGQLGSCPSGRVAAGYCGSGANADVCMKYNHLFQTINLCKYNI